MIRAMLMLVLSALQTHTAAADDGTVRRMYAAAEALTPGMAYADVREKMLGAGWRVFEQSPGAPHKCSVWQEICDRYPETSVCWTDGETLCQLEFRDTDRLPAELWDDVLTIVVKAEKDGLPVFKSQHIAALGGNG